MNARQLLNFTQSKTGRIVLFGLLLLIGGSLFYGYRVSRPAKTEEAATKSAPTPPQKPVRVDLQASPYLPPAEMPRLAANAGDSLKAPDPKSTNAPALPVSLYNAPPETVELSDVYAPYGRLIPCETIITIDSSRIATPIIGLVTEDVYHDGKLIIPAGAEVHGRAQTDRERERIGGENQWMLVWRTSDRLNGAELPLTGMALDMERDATTGRWALTDGSAGLRGDLIKSDNLAEIKLFAATFLSAASSGLQDTQTTSNPMTGASQQTPLDSPKNAALQATSAVINRYAEQIADAIKKDGFYVRVPAGKQFYLYVTQTIDQQEAKKGSSKLRENRATSTAQAAP